MKLESFQILNFRSVADSGEIEVSRITSLLGRNESGKTNILLALANLNPADEDRALKPIKDFPRHRRLEECDDDTVAVATNWSLSDDEQAQLTKTFPATTNVKSVRIEMNYGGETLIEFVDLEEPELDTKGIVSKSRKIRAGIDAAAGKLADEGQKAALTKAAEEFEKGIAPDADADKEEWATVAVPIIQAARQALAVANSDLTATHDAGLNDLQDLAQEIAGAAAAEEKARDYIAEQIPVFIYLDDYPELLGEQNISAYLNRKKQDPSRLTVADRYFEKLYKVAGLNVEQLEKLLSEQDAETRNQLANRASNVLTTEIKRLWTDRGLNVRLHLDGQKLIIYVSDPTSATPVEVTLDERSRGFRWFFSFYITFAADTQGGIAEDAILLLDEPGLYLHALSQGDLLKHFREGFENQIIYTTHSPFMVPTDDLASVRTVNIAEKIGTTVTNDPSGDSRTLFPLQSALGYNLAQSMFLGGNNLIVEGVTDFWILAAISDYLSGQKKTALHKELTLTPAGGAQKVSYMVTLLTSEQLKVLVLLDREGQSMTTKDELVKSKLIREENVVFVSEGRGADDVSEADLEDLLDADVFVGLVKEAYAKELKGKTLKLNDKIPRISKRVEDGLKDLGIEFHKTRPAKLLLLKMAEDPAKIVTADTAKRFERLFDTINTRFEKHLARDGGTFS